MAIQLGKMVIHQWILDAPRLHFDESTWKKPCEQDQKGPLIPVIPGIAVQLFRWSEELFQPCAQNENRFEIETRNRMKRCTKLGKHAFVPMQRDVLLFGTEQVFLLMSTIRGMCFPTDNCFRYDLKLSHIWYVCPLLSQDMTPACHCRVS